MLCRCCRVPTDGRTHGQELMGSGLTTPGRLLHRVTQPSVVQVVSYATAFTRPTFCHVEPFCWLARRIWAWNFPQWWCGDRDHSTLWSLAPMSCTSRSVVAHPRG